MTPVPRRLVLGGLAGLAVAKGAAGAPAHSAPLPSRGEFVIRDAYVMTMDPALKDLARGSVHVRDGVIVAVGPDIKAPGAAVIPGAGMIVMPGLVDTHSHMWGALLRGMPGEEPASGYFPTAARYGTAMKPDDIYRSTLLCAADALNSGTTTIHDWFHNCRSGEHAEADLKALAVSGLRARWSMGWAQGQPNTQASDLGLLATLKHSWATRPNAGLVSMGFAWRGMVRMGPMPESVYRAEYEAAKGLGLPITVHAGAAQTQHLGEIAALAKAGFLGPDLQIVHALSANAAEVGLIKASGAAVSVSPGSELGIGYGLTRTGELLAAGVPLGASTDTVALVGDGSMFGTLKLMRALENGRRGSEFAVSARRALEIGAIEGARSLGLGDITGSITPGKRADIVMLSTAGLNMGVVNDPAHLVVEAAGPQNVDTVIVDGRILKRHGRLTALDADAVVAGARSALAAVRRVA
jgi:5-methylthioadenosine/S-adenosylhomocysteine deaminase